MSEPKNKGGRPTKDLDQKMFEGMCRIQCTKEEFCDLFDVDEKTLTKWCKRVYGQGFSDAFKRLSAGGKRSLRRVMFEKAIDHGNVTMMIWLSKQYLGMTEKIVNEHTEIAYSVPEFLKTD
jgi:hypothetical protein